MLAVDDKTMALGVFVLITWVLNFRKFCDGFLFEYSDVLTFSYFAPLALENVG